MIAIHYETGNNYCIRWKEYCIEKSIPYKLVSCYDNDILEQLEDCKGLLWHVNHFNYKDQIFAKYLIKALENRNISVFPNDRTSWHYDDKVAQKYLLESINAPIVDTFVFYDKKSAYAWIEETTFPKVFKLRKGSGSKNVQLAKSKEHAKKLTRKAFGKGFPSLDMSTILKERYRKYKLGKESFLGVLKGVVRLIIGTPFKNMSTNEKGYIYFQEFMPGNTFDLRVIVVGQRAFAHKRMVRKDDFRASGSGNANFDKNEVDVNCIKIALDVSDKLGLQSSAYDFIYDSKGKPRIVELSFAFNPGPNRNHHPGYWDADLNWHEENVLFEEWMIDDILGKIEKNEILKESK
ncbi:hypothetical protein JQC67_11505 [Aurantibacter crassamenti]|uniref:ATP-grasp domain-containing protein n=1 Tax=Aurantibacter crassamenti TaxID=1837375 RepID=UPI0019393D31|nr:hypothetical protein [Aurantibacter crassamenti]MBM1106767.1 hypothetical protein [Aurantibacter crassamenti]